MKTRFWLKFDRSLTHGMWKLVLGVLVAIGVIWAVSSLLCFNDGFRQLCDNKGVSPLLLPFYLLIDTNALNNLYINDGPQLPGSMLFFCTCIYVVGLVIFNGVLISLFVNFFARRKQNYEQGTARYKLSGHYVIMGYDDMVPSVINNLLGKKLGKKPEAKIVVLSAVETVKIRERLRKAVERKYMDNIIVYYGHRIAKDYYPSLCLEYSEEIFVVGKRTLPNHDAVNVECVKNIYAYLDEYRKKKKVLQRVAVGVKNIYDYLDKQKHGFRCLIEQTGKLKDCLENKLTECPRRITCVFEDFDTYAAFQRADIFLRKNSPMEFVPYNFYVGWAKQLFVKRRYNHNRDNHNREWYEYEYPAVYRNGIGLDDEHYVHLVFVGTSTFAVVLALEAAHIFHFPNATRKEKPLKTRITFIDINADTEMRLFRTRNRHLFEIQSCLYRDLSRPEPASEIIAPTVFTGTDADFLDVEFEFVKGDIYSSSVQNEVSRWAQDKQQYLSLFFAHANQRDNFCLSMNMPDEVYDNEIPIFVRQDNADTFITELRCTEPLEQKQEQKFYIIAEGAKVEEDKKRKHKQRYAQVFPFGMNNAAFCNNTDSWWQAKLMHYLYSRIKDDAFPDRDTLNKIDKDELCRNANEKWRNLTVSNKWSNLYAVDSFPCKQASVEAMGTALNQLTSVQTEIMAKVEHNRWNVEKLLMGYRKPRDFEDKYTLPDDAEHTKDREDLKGNKQYFVHADIRPYEQLDNVKQLDKEIIKYITWITDNADKLA